MKTRVTLLYLTLVLKTAYASKLLNYIFPLTETSINFYFYNKSDTTNHAKVDISDPQEVANAGFDRTKDTYFCVHGYTDSPKDRDSACHQIKRVLLPLYDVNYILIDWSSYSTIPLYTYVQMQIPKIADLVAGKIINMIDRSGLDMTRSQLVGVSMGAHLAGAIGTAADGLFQQVVGVEPAGPLFFHSHTKNRLSRKSGKFVQAIHTGGKFMGMGYYGAVGHADYYSNGGKNQPNCGLDLDGFCSHIRATELYKNSLRYGPQFNATKCNSARNYELGVCTFNEQSPVGGYLVDRNASGKYFFDDHITHDYYPTMDYQNKFLGTNLQ